MPCTHSDMLHTKTSRGVSGSLHESIEIALNKFQLIVVLADCSFTSLSMANNVWHTVVMEGSMDLDFRVTTQ